MKIQIKNNARFIGLKLTAFVFALLMISGYSRGQISITSTGTAFTENFDGIGSSSTATLPSGWRVETSTNYSLGTLATTRAYGTTGTGVVTGSSGGGTVNWANGITASSTERAVGFLTSSSYLSPRNLFVQITNNTGSTISSLSITFDIEKYRSGIRAYTVNFYSGTDGTAWTAQTSGDQSYALDANNTTVYNPPTSISKTVTINGLSIADGAGYYLRWAYTGTGGSTNAQGLGFDNFSITASTGSTPVDPATFTAIASSTSQIDLASTPNGNGDNIVVVYNGTGTFTTPVDGTAAGNAGDAFAGGTIWYKGASAALSNHTGLAEGQTVYYKAFSFDAGYYFSPGATASATTWKSEPTNYPSSFSAVQGIPTYKTIDVSWIDATGGTVPEAYLIKGSSVGYGSIIDPVDGVPETNDVLVRNVTAGAGTYSFAGLPDNTTYYFKIYPYTNSGTFINYKVDGVVPQSTAATTIRPWIEDFETGSKGAYTIGSVTCSEGSWTMDEALIGNAANDRKNELWSVRMRNSIGSIYMNFDKTNGAGTVTVYHAVYGTDDPSTWKLQKSTDEGGNWTDIGSIITTSTNTLTPEIFTVNQPGNVRFKIYHISGGRLNIDDITITDFADPPATTSIATGNWSDASIWDNGIPGDASNVLISSGTTVTLDNIDICNNLVVNPNAALNINSGKSISLTQKFTVKSNATGTGSLIDENTASSINGTIEIERFISPDRWWFITSPVINATSNVFLNAWLKDYNEQTCLWNNPNTSTNTPLLTGKGFALWDTTTNGKTFIYSGIPNMGDVTPTILADTGFKLVGNPYTSAISWQDPNWIKTEIGATIYTWNGSNYDTWNGSFGNLSNGIIPSGQAFFVYSSGTTPVLTIPKSARTNNTQAFYKSLVPDLLVLTADGNGYTDQSFINFNANATSGFDLQYDGFKLRGIDEAPQLYSYDACYDYSINVLPELYSPLTVSLGFSVGVSGNYSITASELNSFDQNILITLEDLKTSQVTDLRQNPVVNFTAANTDDANRFLVHFGRSTTGIDNTGNNDIRIYSSSGNIYVHSNGSEGNVYLYDMLGQQLTSEKLKSSTLNKLTVNTTGYYMVKVVTSKSVSVKKVLCII